MDWTQMSGERRKVVVGAAVAMHFHERGDHLLAVDVKDHQTPASENV